MGLWRYISNRLGAVERDRDNARDRAESLVRNIEEAEGVVRGAREIE